MQGFLQAIVSQSFPLLHKRHGLVIIIGRTLLSGILDPGHGARCCIGHGCCLS
jgi:hypothetical protein